LRSSIEEGGASTVRRCRENGGRAVFQKADVAGRKARSGFIAKDRCPNRPYVGKTNKTQQVPGFLGDKIWGKLFDCASETVLVTFVPKSAECAIAGIGLQHSFKEHDKKGNQYYDKQTVDTLGVMRGRPFDILASGTWHVFKWVTNHEDCYKYLETAAANMKAAE